MRPKTHFQIPKKVGWVADQLCSICKTKVGLLYGGACAECFSKLHQKALKGDQCCERDYNHDGDCDRHPKGAAR